MTGGGGDLIDGAGKDGSRQRADHAARFGTQGRREGLGGPSEPLGLRSHPGDVVVEQSRGLVRVGGEELTDGGQRHPDLP
ncbi:hypothetical protein BO226_04470 [Rhodococcus sp. 2G]|nr:hypothetical protein BO226_04470 [Rhodococcus sp. 2G]